MQTRRNFLALVGSSVAILAAPSVVHAALLQPDLVADHMRWPIQRFNIAEARARLAVRLEVARTFNIDLDFDAVWHTLALDSSLWTGLDDGLVDAKRGDILRFGDPRVDGFVHLPLSCQTGIAPVEGEEDSWYIVAYGDGYRTNRPGVLPNSGECDARWITFMHEAISARNEIMSEYFLSSEPSAAA